MVEETMKTETENKMVYACDTCQMRFPSQAILDIHLSGSKHQKKVLARQLLAKLQQMESCFTHDSANGTFLCLVCNIEVTSPQLLNTHFAGIKHKIKASRGGGGGGMKDQLVDTASTGNLTPASHCNPGDYLLNSLIPAQNESATEDQHDGVTELYFTVPEEKAGLIIGRGGIIIQTIREESGATIDRITDSRLEKFQVIGTQQQVDLAKELIEQTVDGTDVNLHFTSNLVQHDGVTELYLIVPEEKAGIIIGRGGSVIQSIREESGATMDQITNSTVEKFQIKGTAQQVILAKEILEKTVDGYDLTLHFTSNINIAYKLICRFFNEKVGCNKGQTCNFLHRCYECFDEHPEFECNENKIIIDKPKDHDQHDGVSELYLFVPEKKAGIIIGKGGSVIQRIRVESGATIDQITDSTVEKFQIKGTAQQVDLAKEIFEKTVDGYDLTLHFISNINLPYRLICRFFNEKVGCQKEQTCNFMHRCYECFDKHPEFECNKNKIINTETKDQHDGVTELYLIVPEEKAGIIIGRGGSVIQKIREESGATIDQITDSMVEKFQIKGTQQQVDLAKEILEQIVDGKGVTLHFNSNIDPHDGLIERYLLVPEEKAGIIIGRGGSVIQSIREESGAAIDQIIDRRFENFQIKGTAQQVDLAKEIIEKMVDGYDINLHFTSNIDQHDGVTQLYFTVPEERAGLVIGRGGTIIQSIREVSGATIDKINDPKDEKFQIKGTQQQVDLAKQILEQTLDGKDLTLHFTSDIVH